jgi:hypothetical protein
MGVRSVGGARGVTMVSASRGGTKGVRCVGIAMVLCVAMVPKMSLGIRNVGGLRTAIGYLRAVRSLEAFQCSSYGRYNSS